MADRNLLVYHRPATVSLRDGRLLYIPGSGFDWHAVVGGHSSDPDPNLDDSAAQQYPLGTKLVDGDRIYRYALAGGSSLVAGNVLASKAVIAGHLDEIRRRLLAYASRDWASV